MTARAVMVSDHTDKAIGARPEHGGWSWIMRAANFVVAVAEVEAGTVLRRDDHPDESMAFLVDVPARVVAGEETIEAAAESLVILPPGSSRIEAGGSGTIARIFSNAADDLVALASNAADYGAGAPDVAPLTPWPDPIDGFRLRYYPLTELLGTPGSDLRVFRSTNLMINFLGQRDAPRDTGALSPHFHTDFEQASLALRGRYVHHARYPWTKDMTQWREDEHLEVGSPSITVIPNNVIHTSRNVDAPAWLVDIFAPPRQDFSQMPGAVKNADEYPMPAADAVAPPEGSLWVGETRVT